MKYAGWVEAGAVAIVAIALSLLLSFIHTKNIGQITTDVSWPNCQGAKPSTATGIVGVTGGLDFRPNACATSEATWFPNVALYMNTGWPGADFHLQFPDSPRKCTAHEATCLAYNYGYHAAQYALTAAGRQLVHGTMWWLDVETENSWTTDMKQNQAALTGMVAAIQRSAPLSQIGFYSYPGQWRQIVGSWRPDFPAWVATGGLKLADAVKACKALSFTAGPVVMAQYTPLLDQNYLC